MPLYRLEEPSPALTAPVVVAAFDGWIDAAGAASSAADQLANDGELLATFEGDVLFDYRSRRPTLDVVDGTLTRLVWPTLELHRRGASGRWGFLDLILGSRRFSLSGAVGIHFL